MYSSIFLFKKKEAVRLGKKRWQDVGIAVCVHRPAMPPYCHFFLLSAANVPKDILAHYTLKPRASNKQFYDLYTFLFH